MKRIVDIHPVGSIYISANSTSPASLFGGTWEQIKDSFLLSAGDVYNGGETGGSATHSHTTAGHTLTVAEMPSHTHTQNSHRHTATGTWAEATYGSVQGYAYSYNRGLQNRYTSYTTATNQNTGGGGSHSHGDTGGANSLPPYTPFYVWKRTE